MRTETIIKEIYTFAELSEGAQAYALKKESESRYESIDLDMFDDDSKEYLYTQGFRDAELSYSLNYCQGDGLSFSANIDIDDMLTEFNPGLKQSVKDCIYNYTSVTIKANTGRYCFASRSDIDVYFEANNREYTNFNEIVDTFSTWLKDKYIDLCTELEKNGYAEIEYQTSEDCAREYFLANNIEFTADGEQY